MMEAHQVGGVHFKMGKLEQITLGLSRLQMMLNRRLPSDEYDAMVLIHQLLVLLSDMVEEKVSKDER